MQNFAEQLGAVRKERHITQEQLAQEMNVSRTTISRWEKGIMMPDIDTIKHLSKVLNYNFFTVEGLAEEAQTAPEAEEIPAQPEENTAQETAVQQTESTSRKKRFVLPAVLGAVLLCAVLIVCLLTNQKPADEPAVTYEPFTYEWYQQEQTPVERQAFVSITIDEDPVPVIRDADFPEGLGWRFCFKMEEVNGVPFTVEKITYQMFASETRCDTWTYEGEDILMAFGNPNLSNGRVAEWRGGLKYQPMKGAAIAIEGTDANGNALTFYRFAELSQEIPE